MGYRSVLGPGALRLGLASTVFVFHISSFGIGSSAVYVFFVLSGYWTHRMWSRKYSLGESPCRSFYLSRLWRLLPVFLLSTAISLWVNELAGQPASASLQGLSTIERVHSVVANLAILGYDSSPLQPLIPAWSLDMEAQFYLLVPVMAWLVLRAPYTVLVVSLLVSAVSKFVLDTHGLVTLYLVFFVLGMTIAHVGWRPAGRLAAVSILACAFTILVFVGLPWTRDIVIGGSHTTARYLAWNPGFNIVLATLLIPYAIWTCSQKGGPHDGMYADMSYGLYLLHWPAAVILGMAARLPMPLRLSCAVVAIVGTYLVTWLVWRYFDRPINEARARYLKDRAPVATPVGTSLPQ